MSFDYGSFWGSMIGAVAAIGVAIVLEMRNSWRERMRSYEAVGEALNRLGHLLRRFEKSWEQEEIPKLISEVEGRTEGLVLALNAHERHGLKHTAEDKEVLAE